MKVFRCTDVIPGCPTVIEEPDVAQVLTKAVKHLERDHAMSKLTCLAAARAEAAIRDE